MLRKVCVVFLIVIFMSIQDATLAKAESVYEESLKLDIGVFRTMGCGVILELSVSTLNGPFDASEITSEPGFFSLIVLCYPNIVNFPQYNISFSADVQVYLNRTGLSDALQGKRMADDLKKKVEDLFNIFLVTDRTRSPIINIYGIDYYLFIGEVSVVEQFWNIFNMQSFPGFSELFSLDSNNKPSDMELRLEKIGGSYMWIYKITLDYKKRS